jgi:tetratricopeptide (TPR) repeat protein
MQYSDYGIPEPEGARASQVALDLCNWGAKCREEQKYAAAEIAFRKCVVMHPDIPVFWSNLGAALLDQDRHAESMEALAKALELEPLAPKAIGNLALAEAKRGNFDKAMELFERALELGPGDKSNSWNRTCVMLSQGHWEVLRDYERLRPKHLGDDYFKRAPFPYWDGKQDLNGKKLFVQFDQGLGDRILFSRFVYYLKQQYPACQIQALAHEKMNSLLWGYQEENIATLLPDKIPFPKCDYGVYLNDLAGIYGITPDTVPPDPGIILKRVQRAAKKLEVDFPIPLIPSVKVGICWTGNPGMPRNRERQIPPELLLSLAEIPNVALYSLQAGAGAEDIKRVGAEGLMHCGPGFGADLEDKGLSITSAVMLNLDVIITCCTSIAHLAGVLGVPTWLLLSYDPYWVWLRKGETTQWYPSITIFRQPEPKAWQPVIDEVKARLKQVATDLVTEVTS